MTVHNSQPIILYPKENHLKYRKKISFSTGFNLEKRTGFNLGKRVSRSKIVKQFKPQKIKRK